FATRGRELLNIEDELFDADLFGTVNGNGTNGHGNGANGNGSNGHGEGLSGYGTLISALETARSGRLGDIVATIQGEQDEIIPGPLPGARVGQGGAGARNNSHA